MPLQRLKAKTTKEILWVYLLRLLKEREMYAYEVRSRLRERFGFEPALVTSYVVLYRLERDGYVAAEWRENKKYYRLTEKGRELYNQGIEHLDNLLKKLKISANA